LKIDHPNEATLLVPLRCIESPRGPVPRLAGAHGNVTCMRWELVLSVAAFVLALIAVVIGVMVYQRVKPAAAPEKEPSPAPEAAQPDAEKSGPPAFVVNPTKVSLPAFRDRKSTRLNSSHV